MNQENENQEPAIEQIEAAVIEQPNAIEQKDIKVLHLNQKPIRYYLTDDTYYICVDDLFAIIFDKGRTKYHQIAKLKENFKGYFLYSKTSSNIDSFFAEYDIHTRLYECRIQKSTYEKSPENYQSYCLFMQKGGMNQISAALGLEQLYPYKDLSELGYLPIDSPEPETEIVDETIAVIDEDPKTETNTATESEPTVETETVTETETVSNSTENEVIKPSADIDIVLSAIEQMKKTSDANFENLAKNDADLLQLITAAKEDNRKKIESLQQQQAALEQSQKKSLQQQPVSTDDALRDRFTNERIWLRIAICVTLIFLPFTFLGLHKYIAIETPNWFMSSLVFLLCFAIAAVWDGAIFLFTINGKKELAAFGSFVQFVFMSAKFDFIAKTFIDFGYDGYYWQEKAVILCAVIYSPLLLNQISDLAMKGLSNKS